jgi:hypothetical protein
VFRSEAIPENERLELPALAAEIERNGRQARLLADADTIVRTIAPELRSGDIVAILSNGGFGGIHGGALQFFLGAEMGEEAAFAHAELLGERTDRKALEAMNRGDIHGADEDGFAGLETAGLAARNDFLAGSGCGLEHGETITQEK